MDNQFLLYLDSPKASAGGDPDVAAFLAGITANSGTYTPAQATAWKSFVMGAKADGFWSKLSIVMPYTGQQLAAALVAYNVTSKSAFVLTNHSFVSGDYSPTTGLKGDGSTKYLQTGFIDTTNLISSWSMGAYQTANPDTGSKAAMGTIVSGTQATLLRSCPDVSDGSEFNIGGPVAPVTFTYTKGMLLASRVGTTDTGYANGYSLSSATLTGSLPGLEEYLFAANVGNAPAANSAATQGFAFFGTGLSGQDAVSLTVRVQALIDAQSRSDRVSVLATGLAAAYAADKGTVTSGALAGTPLWLAAPFYNVGAAADTWLSTSSNPAGFSDSDILSQINLYIGNPDGNGNFACFVGPDSSIEYQAGDLGNDVTNHHALCDPTWTGPMWCLDYYQRTGSLTPFTTYKAAMKANLLTGANAIPRGANNLVNVPSSNAHVYRPWGFYDGIDTWGENAIGSVFMYRADMSMATLYGAAGDNANSNLFLADAALLKAGLSTLYDAVSGMFFACSAGGNAANIDIYASAFAVYSGMTTPTQTASVASYLMANYQTAFNKDGFAYESPAVWAQPRFDSPLPTGVYDDGAWSWGMLWVIYAISLSNPAFAHMVMTSVSCGRDVTMEWWVRPPYTGSGGPTNGATNNMASIAQNYGASLI